MDEENGQVLKSSLPSNDSKENKNKIILNDSNETKTKLYWIVHFAQPQ